MQGFNRRTSIHTHSKLIGRGELIGKGEWGGGVGGVNWQNMYIQVYVQVYG